MRFEAQVENKSLFEWKFSFDPLIKEMHYPVGYRRDSENEEDVYHNYLQNTLLTINSGELVHLSFYCDGYIYYTDRNGLSPKGFRVYIRDNHIESGGRSGAVEMNNPHGLSSIIRGDCWENDMPQL